MPKSSKNMNKSEQRELLTSGSARGIIAFFDKNQDPLVARSASDWPGTDMFFPSRNGPHEVKLTGKAANLAKDLVLRTGSMSLRVIDENGNQARLTCDSLEPVIIDSTVSASTWWSFVIAECKNEEAAEQLEQRLQDTGAPAVRFSVVKQLAEGHESAIACLTAIEEFSIEQRGLNLMNKPAMKRYNLATLVGIFDPSGGPDNSDRFWTNVNRTNTQAKSPSMSQEFGQNS